MANPVVSVPDNTIEVNRGTKIPNPFAYRIPQATVQINPAMLGNVPSELVAGQNNETSDTTSDSEIASTLKIS